MLTLRELAVLFSLTSPNSKHDRSVSPPLLVTPFLYFDAFVKPQFPPSATVYDYYVDPKKLDWEPWEPKVAPFRYLKTTPFHKMIVPTVDTVRGKLLQEVFIIFALAVTDSSAGVIDFCRVRSRAVRFLCFVGRESKSMWAISTCDSEADGAC